MNRLSTCVEIIKHQIIKHHTVHCFSLSISLIWNSHLSVVTNLFCKQIFSVFVVVVNVALCILCLYKPMRILFMNNIPIRSRYTTLFFFLPTVSPMSGRPLKNSCWSPLLMAIWATTHQNMQSVTTIMMVIATAEEKQIRISTTMHQKKSSLQRAKVTH